MSQTGETSRFDSKRLAHLATVVTAGALTLFAATHRADAAPTHRTTPAERIAKRIRNHLPVRFDTNDDRIWATANSTTLYDRVTTLPVIGKDHGQNRAFRLVQRGNTLASLGAVELPKDAVRVESMHDPYYNCGATANHAGQIYLNANGQPVVTLRYSNGKVYNDVPAGHTEPFVSNGPIIGPPPVPPGFCPPEMPGPPLPPPHGPLGGPPVPPHGPVYQPAG